MPIISLQVSDDLSERFEKVRVLSGFNSKSEALRDAIVNLGRRMIWGSEYDITENQGYRIFDISEGSIRGDYRSKQE